MTSPRVSVLMPLYNCEAHLVQSLASLVGQTYGDFEIVAVDDGSTDATGDMLEEFAANEPRCRVIHTRNGGIVAALNTAAAAARGVYLARLDGDDIARSDRFAEQVDFLDRAPGCVCVGSLYRMIDETGRVFKEQKPFGTFRQTDLDTFPPFVASPPHPSIMLRRDAFEAIGGYRAAFPHAEDHDLFLRLTRRGRIDLVQKPLLDYRVHLGSLSARNIDRQTESALCAVLSAVVVARDLEDPATTIARPVRDDFYRVIDDIAFQEVFDLYGELCMASGAVNRQLFGQAVQRLGGLVPRLCIAFPRHAGDRRYWGLVRAFARTVVRLALRKI